MIAAEGMARRVKDSGGGVVWEVGERMEVEKVTVDAFGLVRRWLRSGTRPGRLGCGFSLDCWRHGQMNIKGLGCSIQRTVSSRRKLLTLDGAVRRMSLENEQGRSGIMVTGPVAGARDPCSHCYGMTASIQEREACPRLARGPT